MLVKFSKLNKDFVYEESLKVVDFPLDREEKKVYNLMLVKHNATKFLRRFTIYREYINTYMEI